MNFKGHFRIDNFYLLFISDSLSINWCRLAGFPSLGIDFLSLFLLPFERFLFNVEQQNISYYLQIRSALTFLYAFLIHIISSRPPSGTKFVLSPLYLQIHNTCELLVQIITFYYYKTKKR